MLLVLLLFSVIPLSYPVQLKPPRLWLTMQPDCAPTNLAPKLVLGIGPPLMGVGGHGGGRWAPVFGWIMRA